MEVYKVIFDNNVAVAARKIDCSLRKSVKVVHKDSKRQVQWLPVFAESEQESIMIANKVVNYYFSLQGHSGKPVSQ